MGHFVEQFSGSDEVAAVEAPLYHGVPGNHVLRGDSAEEVEGFGEHVVVGVSGEHDGGKGHVRGRDLVEEGTCFLQGSVVEVVSQGTLV